MPPLENIWSKPIIRHPLDRIEKRIVGGLQHDEVCLPLRADLIGMVHHRESPEFTPQLSVVGTHSCAQKLVEVWLEKYGVVGFVDSV